MTTKRDPQSLLPLTPAMFYVLVALADGQTHGYAILKDVEALTNGSVRLSTGTLYGIIKRLLGDGLIRESGSAEDERRRSVRADGVRPRGRPGGGDAARRDARHRQAQGAVQTAGREGRALTAWCGVGRALVSVVVQAFRPARPYVSS